MQQSDNSTPLLDAVVLSENNDKTEISRTIMEVEHEIVGEGKGINKTEENTGIKLLTTVTKITHTMDDYLASHNSDGCKRCLTALYRLAGILELDVLEALADHI